MTSPILPSYNTDAANASSFVVGPGQLTTSHPATPKSETVKSPFVDRRAALPNEASSERRQFGSSHAGLSEAGRELACAIDQYKLQHHRRYITCDEMLAVIQQLGYSRS